MAKYCIKRIFSIILILIISIALGFLLLIGSHLYIDEYDSNTMANTAETFKQYDGLLYKYFGRWMDPFSDAIITEISTYLGPESAAEKSVEGYRIRTLWTDDIDEYSNLNSLNKAVSTTAPKESYKQYWHGYQVFLRPLFAFLSYNQVKIVNAVIQVILLLVVLLYVYKYKIRMTVPFIVFILFISPVSVANCLHYYPVYYILLLSILIYCLLGKKGRVDDWKLYYLCMFAGIATAYCDLLTSPLVSIAAIMCFTISDDQCAQIPTAKCIKRIVACACMWGVGYGVFWCGKWIILALYEGNQYFEELKIHLIERSSSQVNDITISRIDAVIKNVLVLFSDLKVTIPAFILFLYILLKDIKKIKSGASLDRRYILVYTLPIVMCILFLIFTANHAYIHKFFAYRTLTPCVLCGFATAINAIKRAN